MIELFHGPTPNCWKISIFLEEAEVPYKVTPIYLSQGDQFTSNFLNISPNNKIPAIIDHNPLENQPPLAIFESGAILLYLAEKYEKYLPKETEKRISTIEWVMWQMAGLGPMLGQNGHFSLYCEEKIPYAIDRFYNEALRLYGVLNKQLEKTQSFVSCNEYTIADMAIFPWIMTHKAQNIPIEKFPMVKTWFDKLRNRPSLQKGLAVGKDLYKNIPKLEGEMRNKVFGISNLIDIKNEKF